MQEQQDQLGMQEALRRIEDAKYSNATKLDLSKLDLTRIPGSLVEIAKLRSLDLTANLLSEIPDFLAQISNLQHLNLNQNQITAIPDSLADISKLRVLDLTGNQIAAIPDSLARLTGLQILRLTMNRITIFPDFLSQLVNLRQLFLGYNQITTIPDSLGYLVDLQSLYLHHNRIAAIPDCLSQLVNLQQLTLGNQVTAIPHFLARLAKLEYLNLSNNPITAIPDFIAQLSNLKNLSFNQNQITAMPDFLAQLTKLENLRFANNQIIAIPDWLARLSNLQILDLRRNQITDIPDSLAQLSKLQELYLSQNWITAIPDSLAQLTNLQELDLEGNPLPEELFAALKQGIPTFFRYLESTAKHRVYPRTIKLVLLGEPKSGKTTLLEALKGNQQPCDESREETLGVDVVTIEKQSPSDGKPMYLSAWDFAGQHIEHATHQFFLTENAIYLILWNSRQGTEAGKRDLWYWLELLKMRAREPKFLLVATHTEHTPADLNLSDIERNYSGCRGHFSVDLSTLNGVPALEAKILELAADSPSLRAAWPREWLEVRNAIRKVRQEQPHMSPATFRGLMKKNHVDGAEVQEDLAGQLHHLGEILYFQERDDLSSLVILDPGWVTELIALVVRSKEVRGQNGILRKADLDQLWESANLDPGVREHLIHLMDWFDLTYSTGDRTDMGIVVEALPYSTPEELKQIELPSDQPQTEMIFRFPSLQRHLPPGIPTWGIARAHRLSKRMPWRDAAVFEDKDSNTKSQALILASESTKEVRLRVASDYPPYFFGRMEAILRDTFKRYPGAEPERRFPCPCQPGCSTSYLFETVIKRRNDRKEYVTCDKSGEDVAIESLLSGAKRPSTEAGLHALHSELRRLHTEQFRALNQQMENKCPSVFTLVPSRDFKMLDTWVESMTQQDELELALYCEHDSGWHSTAHSLYRFRADEQWFDSLKKGWNKFANVTKYVGPLAKAAGKAGKMIWAEAAGMAIEKLPEASRLAYAALSSELGEKEKSGTINLETRHILQQLIDHLDSKRPSIEARKGGLHPYIIDDGRLLWLCPEHLRLHKTRG